MGSAILPAIISSAVLAYFARSFWPGWVVFGALAIAGSLLFAFTIRTDQPDLANFVALIGPANIFGYPLIYWSLSRQNKG